MHIPVHNSIPEINKVNFINFYPNKPMIIPKIQNIGINIPGYSLIKSANFPSSALGHPIIFY